MKQENGCQEAQVEGPCKDEPRAGEVEIEKQCLR